jgi:hypothetical protein
MVPSHSSRLGFQSGSRQNRNHRVGQPSQGRLECSPHDGRRRFDKETPVGELRFSAGDRRFIDSDDRPAAGLNRHQDGIAAQGLENPDALGASLAFPNPAQGLSTGLMDCP